MSEQHNEVHAAVGEALRTSVMVAMQAGDLIAQRRMETARKAQHESDQVARLIRDQMRAERDAALPVMRRAWDERWWRRADHDEIQKVWCVTHGWAAGGDPYARATLTEMRDQIKKRHGVLLPEEPLTGADVAALLAADARAGDGASPEGEFSQAPTGRWRAYVVRDGEDRSQVLASGRVWQSHNQPVEELVASRLDELTLDARQGAHAVVEVYDGEQAIGTPVRLAAPEARAAARESRERRRRVVAGEESVPADELLAAANVEARECWEARREQEDRLIAEHGRDESAWPASERAAVHAARVRLSYLNLRRDMAEAELRGEDGAHVAQAATLRRELDEQWWETASRAEAAGVWDHVRSWPPSHARRDAQASLRAGIWRRFGVSVPDEASGAQARELMARAGDEEAAATASADSAAGLRRAGAPARQAAAEQEHADVMGGLADQDAAAAATLASMSDREAGEAVAVAAQGYTPGAAARSTAPRRGGPSRSPHSASRPAARTPVRGR